MAEPTDDHESRIRVLERQIQELREQLAHTSSDAAAARVLAGGADRDVADMRAQLRAHTRLLTALRDTQLEQGEEIRGLRSEMHSGFADVRAEMHSGFADVRAEMRTGFADVRTEMQAAFATMGTGMARIVTLIEGVTPREAE